MTSNLCPICCEKFDKSLHAEVKCHFQTCNFSSCKTCVRTYLTSVTADPHCMNCKNKWSLEFSKGKLNASFMDKDYKDHRRVILADREIAKSAEYYTGALYHGKVSDAHKRMKEVDKEIHDLYRQIRERERLLGELEDDIRTMGKGKPKEEARKFVMPCQNSDCRGMLTTAYRCEICTKYTCSKCLVCIKVGTKEEHTCDENDVLSAEEIKKNSKPCPNCGSRISKIEGCFAKGTGIRMFPSGSKPIQDVNIGDLVYGDDGTSREVIRTFRGHDHMYDVKQNWINCHTYTVNSMHTLVLAKENKRVTMLTKDFYELPEEDKKKYKGIMAVPENPHAMGYKVQIEVLHVGEADYYGFEVAGANHFFLLNDNTLVSNCDQMFCVECKTAFSWSKGTIETGHIHNPHFYEWQRKNGGAGAANAMPANMCGDQFGMIGRFLSNQKYHELRDLTNKTIVHLISSQLQGVCNSEEKKLLKQVADELSAKQKTIVIELPEQFRKLHNFHQYISHIENTEFRDLQTNLNRIAENHDAIYDYILNKIDKIQLSYSLIRTDNESMKMRARRDILEALVMVGKQILGDCVNELNEFYKNKFPSGIPRYDANDRYDRSNDYYNKMKKFAIQHMDFLRTFNFEFEKELLQIAKKYYFRILKYASYSNIESIRHLMTYNSKKSLDAWTASGRKTLHFSTKTAMNEYIEEFQQIYDNLDDINEDVLPDENVIISEKASAAMDTEDADY
jgi:hypothetical protein